jgi:YjjI family glycine radical enzyme
LGHLAATADSLDDFWPKLEHAAEVMMEYMDNRTEFIVRKSMFFQSSFLHLEGFLDFDNFTAMFGIVGLAECVNKLRNLEGHNDRFGSSTEADDLGIRIMEVLDKLLKDHVSVYLNASDKHCLLHGQVGIDTDRGETPAARIPIGEEPADLDAHLAHCARFHPYFKAGTGDIFVFEPTALGNPEYILDLMRGSFAKGMRYISIQTSDSDNVRVTGYLVKRSEMEKLRQGGSVLHNTTALGLGAVNNAHVLDRKQH